MGLAARAEYDAHYNEGVNYEKLIKIYEAALAKRRT
jgi:hypothetical protein